MSARVRCFTTCSAECCVGLRNRCVNRNKLGKLVKQVWSAGAGRVMDPMTRGSKSYEAKDYTGALQAWNIAGARGNAEAKFRIGTLYARGEGVFASVPDAAFWYERAAENGHGDAQYHLARIYLHGAPQHREHANWLAQASANNE